jgi:hypothetical protein
MKQGASRNAQVTPIMERAAEPCAELSADRVRRLITRVKCLAWDVECRT